VEFTEVRWDVCSWQKPFTDMGRIVRWLGLVLKFEIETNAESFLPVVSNRFGPTFVACIIRQHKQGIDMATSQKTPADELKTNRSRLNFPYGQ